MSQISVAVIGAGAAGLCAARHLTANSNKITVSIFEQSDTIGGTWVYTDNVGRDDRGLPIHSSMYKNLKTNLPKEVMAFPDFPFKDRDESFIKHSEVLQYLHRYSQHFQLDQLVRFNTLVAKVHPLETTKPPRWQVTSQCLQTKAERVETYDSVMVCNGHYSVPVVPNIPGIEFFPGKIIHSHNYRHPEDFQGEKIVILGGGASGTDIMLELCHHAEVVFLSHNNQPLPSVLPSNVLQVKGISNCLSDGKLRLMDGSSLEATVILLATGYHYNFPFLTEECGVEVSSRRVQPLYKHLVNINKPSMAFIGVPIQICPFPQFDLQVRFFVKLLTEEVKLPSRKEMLEDLREEERWRKEELGMPDKYFHKMGTLQWIYNREIAELGGLTPINKTVEDLYNAVHERRRHCLPYYKKDKFKLTGNEGFSGVIFDHKTGEYREFQSSEDPSERPTFIL